MQTAERARELDVRQVSRRRYDAFPHAMLAPAIVVLALTTLFPGLFAIWTSFFDYSLGHPLNRHFVALGNYARALLQDKDFWLSLANTIYFTLGAVTIEALLGLALALLVHREVQGQGVIRTLVILPMIMTPVAVSLMWSLLYNPSLGLYDYLLKLVGLPPLLWVSNPVTAMPSVILVDVWQWTPFMFLVILAGLSSLPQEVLEAGDVDGASGRQRLWYITLPLLRPVLGIALLFRFMDAFKTFDIIYTMTGGGPGQATQTLNLYVYMQFLKFLNIGYASAIGMIFVIIIVLVGQRFVRWSGVEFLE
jgi:multiple sugar transport system permease protein